MPARTAEVAPSAGVPTKSAKKFELPALDFKFAALTDGTDIPPPLPSPIKEEPELPKTPSAEEAAKSDTNGTAKTNGVPAAATSESAVTSAAKSGVKRPADDAPASPTQSARQGSIRRILSRNLLGTSYANGEAPPSGHNSMDVGSNRPLSRNAGSIMDEKKAKRSSGWFSRLRGRDNSAKRASVVIEEPKKLAGPPPPMIPELGKLKAKVDLDQDATFGSDLFKNIK